MLLTQLEEADRKIRAMLMVGEADSAKLAASRQVIRDMLEVVAEGAANPYDFDLWERIETVLEDSTIVDLVLGRKS